MDVGASRLLPRIDGSQIPSQRSASNSEGLTFHQALTDASSKTDDIAGAAKQFEALIAGEVLKAVRESSEGGWLGNGDDQTGELTLEMAEQSFAQALAARGGFGIAKIVTAALARTPSKTPSSDSSAPPQAAEHTEPGS